MLVTPSEAYRRSYLESVAEFAADETSIDVTEASFAPFIDRLADEAAGRVAAGKVAATQLWLVDGETYLGRVSIRHMLNDQLRALGGHIGYAIRPSRRRQGHGTRILALALPHVRALGIDPALITCDAANVASQKIIEACGGVLDGTPSDRLRYWVPTS